MTTLDGLILVWSAWLTVSVIFHREPLAQTVTRLGFLLDTCGLFFLLRALCRDWDDLARVLRVIPVILVPLAAAMLIEKATHFNVFSLLGGIETTPVVRGGQVRAQGPFDVSILAGTVGAGVMPLILGAWSMSRRVAVIGLSAAFAIVYASTSSGPIMTAMWGVAGLLLWPMRRRLWTLRLTAVALYGVLLLLMNDPPYFLMARIDLTGSSTGWHRSELIRASIEHIHEWWLAGTDRTIHWMPYALTGSSDHTDITNHYLNMGVLGGLPLISIFGLTVWDAFKRIGRVLNQETVLFGPRWAAWCVGASLFAHLVTFLSVTYYDQSIVFVYLPLVMTLCLEQSSGIVEPASPTIAATKRRSRLGLSGSWTPGNVATAIAPGNRPAARVLRRPRVYDVSGAGGQTR